MTRFLSRRRALGVGLLVLGAVLSVPSPGRAAPARKAAAANVDQGILEAIDDVAGLIARANGKNERTPGLDRALRDLVSALTHEHKHKHHHRHHRHEGFGSGLQGGKGNLDTSGAGAKDGGPGARSGKGEERQKDGKDKGRGEREAREARDKARRGEGAPGERVGRNPKGRQEGERDAEVKGKHARHREGLERGLAARGKHSLWRDEIKDVFKGAKRPGQRVGKSNKNAKDGAATVARRGAADQLAQKGKQTFKEAEAPAARGGTARAREGKKAAQNVRAASPQRGGAKGGQTKQALGRAKSAAPAGGVAAGRGPGSSARKGGPAAKNAASPLYLRPRAQTSSSGRGNAYQPRAAPAARGTSGGRTGPRR